MKPTPDLIWFRSLHYGGTHVCLWWAVFPNGTLHIASELVRSKGVISALCMAIRQETRRLKIPAVCYTVADTVTMSGIQKPDMEGETRADTFRHNGITIRESTHDPIQGWTRIRELLGVRPDGRPWLTIDPHCTHLIRALTTAVSDPHDEELVQESATDQPLRALRIGAMSRPAPKPFQKPPLPKNAVGHLVQELRNSGQTSSLAWRSP